MLTTRDILKYLNDNKSDFRQKYFVDKIAIVGSYARGDYNNDSDIDLLVYFLPEAKNNRIFRIYISLQEVISSHLNKNVDIISNGKVLPAFKDIIEKEAIYV
jgi:predicted nucleotidyltransferase